MNILVTGGAGYIGSHTAVRLIETGHSVTIVDNLSNSDKSVVDRIAQITGTRPALHVFDLQDKQKLSELFSNTALDAVIHFAGLKAVGESVQKPLLYYRTNLDATLALLEVMDDYTVRKLVFSSSATVYGSAPVPYKESGPVGNDITSPYGKTKYMIEEIMRDVAHQNADNQFSLLRYFNPVGAHKSGLIGEQPQGIPNNLMPFITQVASKQREKLSIFGDDYDTPDGTCMRDYIHVTDLADGHIAALEHLKPGCEPYNLGSGTPTSVKQMVEAFTAATGKSVPYSIEPRRSGDLPAFHADATKAKAELQWSTTYSIEDMCKDAWNWQTNSINI